MMERRRKVRRAILSAAALLVAIAAVTPFVGAGRFQGPLLAALERALQRKVEASGQLRFQLFPGPGFSLQDVVIHEEERFGIEPSAYIPELEAGIRLRSLWTGRLELSRLRLVEPSVNLVKLPSGEWNFQPLVERARAASQAFPEIEVRDGRLNVKFGATKSVYYLSGADLDVFDAGRRPYFSIRFSGEPARTDRAGPSFGQVSGSGRWLVPHAGGSELDINVRMERTAIAELMILLRAGNPGLDGFVSAAARLRGPVSGLEIQGSMQAEGMQRWELYGSTPGSLVWDFRGRLDLSSQNVEIQTIASGTDMPRLSARLRASDYLSRPRWAMTATLDRLPAGSLLNLVRQVGAPIPAEIAAAGEVSGVLGYSVSGGMQGRLSLQQIQMTVPDAPAVRMDSGQVVVDSSGLRIPAVRLVVGRAVATLEARYVAGNRSLDLAIRTPSMAIADLRSVSRVFLGAPPIPLVAASLGGTLRGVARFRREDASPETWSCDLDIQDAAWPVDGMADPLQLSSAKVTVRAGRVSLHKITARMGALELDGDYEYHPAAERPQRFDISIPRLDASELARLLEPSLRRRQGFLARTLRLGNARAPEWLRKRRAEGTLRIRELAAGDLRLERLRARLYWNGTDVEIRDIQSRLQDGVLTGWLGASLRDERPVYQAGLELRQFAWMHGKVDASGRLSSSGIGIELLANLKAEGSFVAHAVRLPQEPELERLSGCYELAMARGLPRLRLPSVEADLGSETYHGRGFTQPDGRLRLDLASPRRQWRAGGTLWPLQLETLASAPDTLK